MHDHQINEHVPICINYQTSTFEIKQVMIKTGGDVEMKGAGSIHGNMLLSNGIISARMGEIIKKNSVMWNSIHLKGQKLWQLWLKQVDSPGPPPRRHQCLLLHRKKKNLAPWGLTQNNIDRMGKSVEFLWKCSQNSIPPMVEECVFRIFYTAVMWTHVHFLKFFRWHVILLQYLPKHVGCNPWVNEKRHRDPRSNNYQGVKALRTR